MMQRPSLCRLRLPPSPRFFTVLMTLLVYHGSLLHTPHSSSSSSSSSSSYFSPSSSSSSPCPATSKSSPSASSPSSAAVQQEASWLSSWLPTTRRRTPVGASAGRLCVLNREQQRLTEMLNELQNVEDLDPSRLALQQIWMRDQHNLTGVCPTFRPTGSTPYLPGLEQQSLCPWTLEQNYSTNRFPRLLWFARCLCGHCTGSSGSGSPYGRGSASLYTCVPLYHRVDVIREICQDGEIHFRWGRESVPVGCVCAHPSARQVP